MTSVTIFLKSRLVTVAAGMCLALAGSTAGATNPCTGCMVTYYACLDAGGTGCALRLSQCLRAAGCPQV